MCVLITIPISHYCEKARWALDRAGISYREQAHLQLIHWFAVRRAGGGRTAPVLVCGDRVLAESADIVDEADAKAPPDQRLYRSPQRYGRPSLSRSATASKDVRTCASDCAAVSGVMSR